MIGLPKKDKVFFREEEPQRNALAVSRRGTVQSKVCGDERLPIPPQRLVGARLFLTLFLRKAPLSGGASSS